MTDLCYTYCGNKKRIETDRSQTRKKVWLLIIPCLSIPIELLEIDKIISIQN